MQQNEAYIRENNIRQAILDAGWDSRTQVMPEVYLVEGRIEVQGKLIARGKTYYADYILYYKPNIPIAVVEAKRSIESIGSGTQQAL
ncbi:MAG: restriction endonuclease, partial [Chloroflexota bacterium]